MERFAPSTTSTLLALIVRIVGRSDLPVSFVLRVAATLNGSRWEKEPLSYAGAAAKFKPLAASFGSYAASPPASPLRRFSLLNTCGNCMLHNSVAEGYPSLLFPPLAGLSAEPPSNIANDCIPTVIAINLSSILTCIYRAKCLPTDDSLEIASPCLIFTQARGKQCRLKLLFRILCELQKCLP